MRGLVSRAAAFGSGGLFAAGLALAGMTRPSKVLGFLDVAGAWDASLAFVMLGAVAVYFVAYRLIRRRRAPLLDGMFHIPTRHDVDLPLLGGAALFGIGWGLAGYCPGPALVAMGGGALDAAVLVGGMAVGILVVRLKGRPR
jgi:hypothetical protein